MKITKCAFVYLCSGILSASAFAPGTDGFVARQSSLIDKSNNRYSRYGLRQTSLCSTSSADETISNLLEEIKELTNSFSNVSSQANANANLYNSKLEEYERQIDLLSNQLEEATSKIQVKSVEIIELNDKVNIIELKTSNHVRDIKSSKVELDEKLNTLSLDLQTERDLVSSKDKDIQSLEKKNKYLTKDFNRLEKKLSQNAVAIAKSQSENKNLVDEANTYCKETKSCERDIRTMRKDHKDQISKFKNVEALRKKAVEDVLTIELKIKELEGTISTMKKNESKMQSSIESSQKDYESSISKITSLKEEIVHLQQEAENTIAQANLQESSLQNKISDLKKKLADNGNIQDVQLRKDLINVQAKSYESLMEIQLEMNVSEEKASRELAKVMKEMELYEEERRSLRKLTVLGFKRAASLVTFGKIGTK
uniref:Uncharacterized protein n=1 Tax=Chaetoceros debilis TaxID=122233 RepID=A0A7S3VH06_9STRA